MAKSTTKAEAEKKAAEKKAAADKKPDKKTTTAVAVLVTDHGPCIDCSKVVDVVVDPFQVAGKNQLRCVECRAKRIKEKADAEIGVLKEKAASAREEAAQGKLEFPAE